MYWAGLWLLTAAFVLRPWLGLWGLVVPIWWPAALAVAVIACFQALLWTPFGLQGFRIFLTVFVIAGLIAAAQYYALAGASEFFLSGLFLGVATIAWSLGYVGVRRARQGEVPQWKSPGALARLLIRTGHGSQSPFVSAQRAQMWFEWRRNGLALPVMVGLVTPFALMPLLFGQNDVMSTAQTLIGACFSLIVFAGLAGLTVSGSNPWVKDYYGITPFTATLPMSTANLVAAKLKAAMISALVAWCICLAITAAALLFGQHRDVVSGWWQQATQMAHPAKIVVALMTVSVLLIIWTWTRLVGSLLVGLTGRKWVIHGSVYAGMVVLVGLAIAAASAYKNPSFRETLLYTLPWLLLVWALCRLALTAWALREIVRQHLLSVSTLKLWTAAWLVSGITLSGLLFWLVPAEWLPRYYLPFIVLLSLPMVRLAATPLALAWNRHR